MPPSERALLAPKPTGGASQQVDEFTKKLAEDVATPKQQLTNKQQQQQQQQLEQQLEKAEQEDELTPLPAGAAVAAGGVAIVAAAGAVVEAEEVVNNLIIDHHEGSNSEAANDEQQVSCRNENESETKKHEQQQFNRLDPSRRSFSSPSVNLLHQQQQQQQQQASSSIRTTIFGLGRLTKATHSERQRSRNLTCGFTKNSPNQAKPEKLRRRTVLGLIPLVGSAHLGKQVTAANQQQTPTSSSSSSWRSFLVFMSQAPNSTGPNQAANPICSTGKTARFSLRQLSSSDTNANANQSHNQNLISNPNLNPKQQANRSMSAAAAAGRQEQQQQQQQQQRLEEQSDEHVENNNPNNRLATSSSSSSASKIVAADGARSKHANANANANGNSNSNSDSNIPTGQSQAQDNNDNSTQSAGCLSMKSIKGDPTTTTSDNNSATSVNHQSIATNELVQEASNKMMTASRQTGNNKQMMAGSQSLLVDRLIDSQLDWRQLVREANGDAGFSRLSESQIKRQEVIHELVQTERHHCLTLALMRQVYLAGLRSLNESRATVGNFKQLDRSSDISHQQQQASGGISCDLIDLDRLFPALDDLIQAHELFFAHLRLRLLDSCAPSSTRPCLGFVGPLGDLLSDQFRLQKDPSQLAAEETKTSTAAAATTTTTTNGQKLLQAYGKFCGSHFDSSKYYKQLMHNDKGFRQFIESCNKQNPACRQRGIPECNLLVTQRLTKYPLLLEQLIKTSKDEPQEEQDKLRDALRECKCLLAELNQQLARKESFERLLDIYAHFCPKSHTIYNRSIKFTKHDLLQHKRVRQLIHCDGQVRIWSATRRKLFQVLCLILNDIIVFLRFEPSQQTTSSANCTALEDHPGDHSLCLVPSTHQPSLISGQPASFNSNSNNNSSSHYLGQPQQQQQQDPPLQQPSFRYYFANIDNKSSVISLSKLLIREKAAHDQEPRIYLISSNPRQPEMYELAFVSKRHQAGFVDKLKSCIEQHNRRVATMDEYEFGLEEDDFQQYHHHHQHHHGDDNGDDSDDSVELNLEDCECCAICQRDDDGSESDNIEATQLIDAARRGSPSRSNCRTIKSKSLRQKKQQQQQQRRRDTIDGLELDYELDIEQDVLVSPRSVQSSSSSSSSSSTCSVASGSSELDELASTKKEGEASSFVYSKGRSSGGQREASSNSNSGDERTVDEEQEQEQERQLPLESLADSGLSERAKDSLDETAPSKQKLRGTNRRRRAQRPRNVSNQSSSSSEAAHRQAIELYSVCKQLHQLPGAAAAATEDDEFDSGRGHDDSCCSSSSTTSGGGNSLSSDSRGSKNRSKSQPPSSSKASTANERTKGAPVGQSDDDDDDEDDVDERQLIDLESQSSTTSALANESPRAATLSTNQQVVASAGDQQQHRTANATNRAPRSSSLNPSSSSTVGACPEANGGVAIREATKANSASLIKCSSIMASGSGKSFCCCCSSSSSSSAFVSKQRKLSNVSSMSSQLKLISRLKSGFEAAHSGGSGSSSLARQVSSTSKCSSFCQHRRPTQPCDTTTTAMATLSKQMRQQMRRSSFVPEQKLEELRDLRIQLDKDKQEWQAKFNRMQEQLLNERRELDLAREKLKQDRQQVASEREQLYRKLDALKEKGILLSPSHKVIITAPEQTTGRSPAAGLVQYQATANSGQSFVVCPTNQTLPPYSQSTAATLRLRHANQNSIRIHQSQQHQIDTNDSMPLRYASAAANEVTTTNLFIQSNARVPLHLSESSPPSMGTQQTRQHTALSKVTTPLISVIGNNLFGIERSTDSSQRSPTNHHHRHHHMESHVI